MLTVKGSVWKVVEEKTGKGEKCYKVIILQDHGNDGTMETVYFYKNKNEKEIKKPEFKDPKNVEINVQPMGDYRLSVV